LKDVGTVICTSKFPLKEGPSYSVAKNAGVACV
jgi:hypothetical protein